MQTEEFKIERMLAHPGFDHVVHGLAGGFQAFQQGAPRLASQFSTQQRWLMSHAALARHYRGFAAGRPGISRRLFVEDALTHRIASRNTAAAFFDESLKYGIILPTKAGGGSDAMLVTPAPAVLCALSEWHQAHLAALDALDGGDRSVRLREAEAALLPRMQPAVADGLLASPTICAPGPDYAVFASVDEGGSLMDRLIAGLDIATARNEEKAVTNVTSVSALARPLNLSRTHAGRTLSAAIALGSLGWTGTPGRSPIWLSRGFRTGYARMQAAKITIIGEAFEHATASVGDATLTAAAAARAARPERNSPAC
ncbi:hypothetical protein [Bosea sp. BH3]|uniref:hypothetical protein n=1 Tax=Bosea sp. BH3 TaxID=2871701 RepID=UPI0021CAE840|nr:hypothetical protein [Bosea sp. BH3]MCU4179935.1 hypothetical protein [Bosea sp. BH3]